MSKRALFFILLLAPLLASAQNPPVSPAPTSFNATTLAVLLANRPEHVDEAEWLRMMERPVNRYAVPADVARYTFSTQQFAPAMYHFRVREPDGIVGHGRLSVVH